MPILQHAVTGLSKINRVELDEIKSFNRPADTIVNLMTAVCIILRIEPLIRKDKATGGEAQKDYWTPAVGRQCLANPSVIQLLTSVDPLSLDQEAMTNLEEVLEKSELEAEKVRKACKAAESIYHWVLAVRNYYYVYKNTEPLRNKMILADTQLIRLRRDKTGSTDLIDKLKAELQGIRKLHH